MSPIRLGRPVALLIGTKLIVASTPTTAEPDLPFQQAGFDPILDEESDPVTDEDSTDIYQE